MNTRKIGRTIAAACLGTLVVLVGIFLAPPQTVVAFSRSWHATGGCGGINQVEGVDFGLWDDLPGAGLNNESGLLWRVTKEAANENCSYVSMTGDVNTTDFPILSVRAAVNDGAIYTVALRDTFNQEIAPPCSSDIPLIASLTFPPRLRFRPRGFPGQFDEFLTQTVKLPPGRTVTAVCITIDDNADNIASQRASALIDYIKIGKNASPPCNAAVCLESTNPGWVERFSRPN